MKNSSKLKSKSTLLQVKSALAGALLKGKVKIEHSPSVAAPLFDKKNNRILLPNWTDVSEDLYDTLCGNATGHAIWTPNGSVGACGNAIKSVCPDNLKTGETYLSIVEDSRVERLLFSKYVGYRKRFKSGYAELADGSPHFEYDVDKINQSSFADRYNFFFKFGDTRINFSDDEQKLVEQGSKIRTWKQSVSLAKAMYEQDVENQQSEGEDENEEEQDSDDPQDGESGSNQSSDENDENDEQESEDDSSDGSGSDDSEDEDSDQDDSGDSGDDSEGDGDSDSDSDGSDKSDGPSEDGGDQGGEPSESDGDAPSSGKSSQKPSNKPVDHSKLGTMTNDFEEAKNNLDQDKSENPKYDYAEDIDTDEDPSEKASKSLGGDMSDVCAYDDKIRPIENLVTSSIDNMNNTESRARANKLASRFNLAKNAKVNEKTREYRTGKLDPKRLHQYKLSDNIFLADEAVPEGKNHAVTMLIDCSGSMCSVIDKVFTQMHDLILFCKAVDIPYRVYGFTDNSYGSVFEIIRNDYSKSRHKECMQRIHSVMQNGSDSMNMSGTPLMQALEVIKNTNHLFLNANGAEVHNLFILTDGGGNGYGKYTGQGFIVENGKMFNKGKNAWEGSFLICDLMKNLNPNTNVAWFHISGGNVPFDQYGLKKDLDKSGLTVYESKAPNGSPDVLFHFKNNNFYENYEVFTEKLVKNMRSSEFFQ